ncbi:hypothetical protein M3672_00690 [Microbacterium enclense]|uniref:hypothetical protein n=1 Tax=Microbacterium enclense TaxID=993073 RepID=UPI00203FA05F|nr:hypothetical protein [Microbacterium enclense]MCM3612953.1 hypothetical protein [Microbacterium enclense]
MWIDDDRAEVPGVRNDERATFVERHREEPERPRHYDSGWMRLLAVAGRRESRRGGAVHGERHERGIVDTSDRRDEEAGELEVISDRITAPRKPDDPAVDGLRP